MGEKNQSISGNTNLVQEIEIEKESHQATKDELEKVKAALSEANNELEQEKQDHHVQKTKFDEELASHASTKTELNEQTEELNIIQRSLNDEKINTLLPLLIWTKKNLTIM